ncbi:MAG: nicotinate phosphoribosyltransferase [Chloroflexi bacterium]|nr:nicotinate phosphoribosyltransferase [Chloroflexota bacterium]
MSIFNGKRLPPEIFALDIDRLRQGFYSDQYFERTVDLLAKLSANGYSFQADSPRLPHDTSQGADVGDMVVEAQWFTRREPQALIGGIDYALALLRTCTGYVGPDGDFVNTWDQLEVEAVQDGVLAGFSGDPMAVTPVLRVRGNYRHFALLETLILGALTRISRLATNTYEVMVAAHGKPILFFPARYDLYHTQAADGYAYHLGVQRYNHDYNKSLRSFISTHAQGAWWEGQGSGTVPHAAVACFLGNTTETMLQFAALEPPEVPRIALVDFNNDCVGTSLAVAYSMFDTFRRHKESGDDTEADKFRLFAVRLDTGSKVRDIALEPLGDPDLDLGVNPRLVWAVRQELNRAWESWDLPPDWQEEAKQYCENIQIVATSGFSADRIRHFEELNVPVDIYGVGSSLMRNASDTSTDFTQDVVRVKVSGEWVDMAKVGRRANDNPDLAPVPTDYGGAS